METINKKYIVLGLLSFVGIIIFLFINPWSWNDATTRTVVTQFSGKQFVKFEPGAFYAGFFAKTTEYPNQISVSHMDTVPNLEMADNTVEVGRITIRFNDATTAEVSGITQYILPSSEKEMHCYSQCTQVARSFSKKKVSSLHFRMSSIISSINEF